MLTALTVMSLIEEGRLELGTTARSVLGGEEIERPKDASILPSPVHELATTEPYVASSTASRRSSRPASDSRTATAATSSSRCSPSASPVSRTMTWSSNAFANRRHGRLHFLRSDDLPERTALGYLDPNGHRTNVFHLAVRGTGDGGIYTTAADMHTFWKALFAGRIVRTDTVTEMLRPRSDVAGDLLGQYGLGFWLFPQLNVVELHGSDAGVSFQTDHSAE